MNRVTDITIGKVKRYHDAEFKLRVYASARSHYDFFSPEGQASYKASVKAASVSGMVSAMLDYIDNGLAESLRS